MSINNRKQYIKSIVTLSFSVDNMEYSLCLYNEFLSRKEKQAKSTYPFKNMNDSNVGQKISALIMMIAVIFRSRLKLETQKLINLTFPN